MACLRPKAPVGRFLDASGAALGRFLAHLGRLLGGSWAVLGTKLGRPKASWRTSWRTFHAKMESSWHESQINHESDAKLVQRLKSTIFSIDFEGFLKLRGLMLGGKIDCGVSWRRFGSLLKLL